MKKILVLLTLLSLFILPKVSADNQYDKAFRFNIQGWIYLYIEGEPYERGFQHGYLLSSEIVDTLHRWSNIIYNHPRILSKHKKISEIWWNFCVSECYRRYWDKFPQEYRSEIQGIADGVAARGGRILGRTVCYKDILAMNEMYELMSKLSKLRKGIHPLLTLFKKLEPFFPDFPSFIKHFGYAHHCNGFIATGNATSNGQLVVAHSTICGGASWWWTYYISLRWNVIIDINPKHGNRIIMTSSPGYIWSDEDYYQSDAGIVLVETTLPQGLYDNKGLPLCVRARKAIQYGNSIDEVIHHLRHRNDGSMNAVWLIGDAKTGEICRFELGYIAHQAWRTFNGFYWSSNNPYNIWVRLEKFSLRKYLQRGFLSLFFKVPGFGYYTLRYRPESRDIKYEELGKKYYGSIDVDIVKKISTTSPISDWITDCKITDTELLKRNGLWAFYGNPYKPLNITEKEQVPPCGWVRIFGIPPKGELCLLREKGVGKELGYKWKVDLSEDINYFSTHGTIKEDTIFVSSSSGFVYAIEEEEVKWSTYVGQEPTRPIVNDNLLLVGHSEGLSILDLKGNIKDFIPSERVVSVNEKIFGDKSGNIYDLSGKWNLNLGHEVYLSSTFDDTVYVNSGEKCYAIRVDEREVSWVFETNGSLTSPPIFSDGTVYFNSWDNFIYAVDAESGRLKWKYEAGFGFDTPPLVYNGLVIAGCNDNNLYALNARNGSLVWVFSCEAGIHSSPVAHGDQVFFGCDDGRFYALDISTGEPLWFFSPGFTIRDHINYMVTPILSDPILYKNYILIGSKGALYAIEIQKQGNIREESQGEILQEGNLFVGILFLFLFLFLLIRILAPLLFPPR
jgi:outer membrane protein assembly factor BamB